VQRYGHQHAGIEATEHGFAERRALTASSVVQTYPRNMFDEAGNSAEYQGLPTKKVSSEPN
jgi:hypothetical protein